MSNMPDVELRNTRATQIDAARFDQGMKDKGEGQTQEGHAEVFFTVNKSEHTKKECQKRISDVLSLTCGIWVVRSSDSAIVGSFDVKLLVDIEQGACVIVLQTMRNLSSTGNASCSR